MAKILITGVIHQRQLTPVACWYTSLQMAVRYFENRRQASILGLSGPENFPPMQKRFADGGHPSWAEWRRWAGECGLTALNLTPNQNGIYQYLSIYGPIVYSGTWGYTFDGHVVVLTGIDTSSNIVYVDDPLEKTAPVRKSANIYFSQLAQTLWETPLFVFAG